ncbi:MAG: nickel pincer cofactor biosynthesis protein LarC [Lachnospiraceae bacterium]|nr:nickel pincer cofactor biosynthesis protein LarC [Lachnospiraceae bacterium]
MKTLYLDCGMGAAGDMLTAALLELLPDRDAFLTRLNSLGIPGVTVRSEASVKCGITGTHITVTVNGVEEGEHMYDHHHDLDHDHHHDHDHDHHHDHDHEHDHDHDHAHSHSHTALSDIEHIVQDHLSLPRKVKHDIIKVYGLIAEAESHVHGVPVTDIHFHEVGTMDALMDVTAVCMLMNELSPDEVVASPVHVGSGQVRSAHGILPVPAPATAYILQDVPTYGGSIKGELCTPTGAALLKYFVKRFGDMPVMRTQCIGYGMGKKDFEAANCVRAMIGETENDTGYVSELACNVDDMTAEEVGYAMERLFEGGAFEVYTVPIGMKKSRPGYLIRVMCDPKNRDKIIELIYRYTSTIGVRETLTRRFVLDRKLRTLSTKFGDVRVKESTGYGVKRSKLEYDDVARIARETGRSISEIRAEILAEWKM